MSITRFKSVKSIIAGLYRDLGTNTEINEQDTVEWIGEALNMIGSYPQLQEVSTVLTVANHRVELPCDFAYLKDLTHKDRPMYWSAKSAANNYNCPDCNDIPTCCTDYNFYIQDGYINTSVESGDLCMVYLGIPVDEEGYPLVPDEVYFDKALKAYVTHMLDRIQFRKGLLPEVVFRLSEKDWYFYVNSARGAAYMPNAAQMERIKNVWVRLIPKPNEYATGFRNLETRERRNLR
jgi:hypothetical protein